MTTDNEKATAKILLSTDEAVVEKIRRVLTDHPEIVFEVMRQHEEQLMIRQREAEYARALSQSMMNTKNAVASSMLNNTFATSNTPGLLSNTYNNAYGGKK